MESIVPDELPKVPEAPKPPEKPAAAKAEPAPAAAAEPAKPAKKKKKGSCLRGCLMMLVLPLLLAGAAAAIFFDLPTKLHLLKSPAERLYAGTPYREEATAMKEELKASGMGTEGVQLDVFPVADTGETVAIATLDASQGFHFNEDVSIEDALVSLATGDAAQDVNVGRAAIGYKDEKGRRLVTVTVPAEAAADYKAGRITKQEFYARIDGKIDLANVTAAIQEQVNSSNTTP